MLFMASRMSALTAAPGVKLETREEFPDPQTGVAEMTRRKAAGQPAHTPILALADGVAISNAAYELFGWSWGVGHSHGGCSDNMSATLQPGDEYFVLEAVDPPLNPGRAVAINLVYRVVHGFAVAG